MQWQSNTWRPARRRAGGVPPPFTAAGLVLPSATVVRINNLPAPDDSEGISRILTNSQLTRAMLDIRRETRNDVLSERDFLGLLRNYVFTLERRRTAEQTMAEFTRRVGASNIDYSPGGRRA
jgi:hypothetical protein